MQNRYTLKHLPYGKIIMKWQFIWKNVMKCHSDYTRSRLISCVCIIKDLLFTSSGKHFTQLKYKMLEIFFLILVNNKFVIQCTQLRVNVEAYYLCQQHTGLSIDRASGFLLKAADLYEMSGFLLVL